MANSSMSEMTVMSGKPASGLVPSPGSNQNKPVMYSEISGSQGGKHEEDSLLQHGAVSPCINRSTFQTDVSEVRAASIIRAMIIPEDCELHTRRRENLKSHRLFRATYCLHHHLD
jgi:hypothetical protein